MSKIFEYIYTSLPTKVLKDVDDIEFVGCFAKKKRKILEKLNFPFLR